MQLLQGLLLLLLLCSPLLFVAGQEYPHELGPFVLQDYPEFTFGPNTMTGRVWLRVNDAFDRIQFKYELDQDPTSTPYWPFFAMHLHVGPVGAGEDAGPIVISISGKGDIYGFVSPNSPIEGSICSSECLPGALGCDPLCPPNNTFPHIFGYAYSCDGGCNGDGRKGDGNKTIVPSRFCDLDNDLPSNPPQDTWIDGRYSDERSGNSSDGDHYSPYSIFRPGNFDQFCSYQISFLSTLFEPGVYTYVALHTNYNSTGAPDLLFGTLLAVINNGTGIDVMAANSSGSSLSSVVVSASSGLLGLLVFCWSALLFANTF